MSPALVGSWQPLIESVAVRLLEASVWGAALALGVWALCALVPDLPAVWRRWLWWGVALKLLLGLAPVPRVALPVLEPVSRGAAPAAAAVTLVVPGPAVERAPARIFQGTPAPQASLADRLLAGLVGVWALGAALALLAAAGEAWRAARLVRRAVESADPRLRERFARLAAELGTPHARLSRSVDCRPLVRGATRCALPACCWD